MESPRTPFILSAEDPDLSWPWLQVRFETDDFEALCHFAEIDASKDPELERVYRLQPATVDAVCDAVGIAFEHGALETCLYKYTGRGAKTPYLIHTGFELALMVQGRKPFAFIEFDSANSFSVSRKERFDAYVAKGLLHAHEEILALLKTEWVTAFSGHAS